MPDTSKSVWMGAGFVIVIALLGATLWKVSQSPDERIAKRLSAIDSKIESANAALAKTQTATAAVGINQRLSQIDAKIAKIDAALNNLQKRTSLDKLDAIAASLKTADGKLAEIKQAIPAEMVGQFAKVSAQFKNINATLTTMQQARAEGTSKPDALANAVGDLKKNIDEAAALRTKLADAVGRLDDAVKTAAKPKPSEVVVVYLDLPDKSRMPHTVATVSPLQIQFKNIGSADDEGQAAMIVAKLKDIVKDRKGCTISVAGFADTLGGDRTNLTLSKKRARVIAAKLKTAFAEQPVQINESAWGERRLADWTPDQTADKANRRVDVAVSCKE
jgi:outer membrane protein OmpA-like peptidoglycan-associated protein